jgi:hypothetical protein
MTCTYEIVVHGKSGKTYSYPIDLHPDDVEGLRADGLEINELYNLVELSDELVNLLAERMK